MPERLSTGSRSFFTDDLHALHTRLVLLFASGSSPSFFACHDEIPTDIFHPFFFFFLFFISCTRFFLKCGMRNEAAWNSYAPISIFNVRRKREEKKRSANWLLLGSATRYTRQRPHWKKHSAHSREEQLLALSKLYRRSFSIPLIAFIPKTPSRRELHNI